MMGVIRSGFVSLSSEFHRAWMMKSYCFALVFVVSRVPDVIPVNWSETGFVAWQWYLTTAALVGPDIVLTVRELLRRRARPNT